MDQLKEMQSVFTVMASKLAGDQQDFSIQVNAQDILAAFNKNRGLAGLLGFNLKQKLFGGREYINPILKVLQ